MGDDGGKGRRFLGGGEGGGGEEIPPLSTRNIKRRIKFMM